MARNVWTEPELDIVRNEIESSPTNLTLAFENASLVIQRELGIIKSPKSISSKYYNNLKRNTSHPLIAVGSKKGMIINSKVEHRKVDVLDNMISTLTTQTQEGKFLAVALNLMSRDQKSTFLRSIISTL